MCRWSAFVFAVAAMVAGTVSAQEYYDDNGYDNPQAAYDYAQVLEARPIVEYGDGNEGAPEYRQVCWDEPVTYQEPPRHYRRAGSEAGAVLGAIVGGVIGHNIGNHGRHGYLATNAGAALGYAVARDAQGGYLREGRVVTRYERRCEQRPEFTSEQRITGYDVAYRYQGRVYHTVTDYNPGSQIRVRVDVSAAP